MNRARVVKQARINLEMTQEVFSNMMGVTESMISKYENGVNKFEDSHVFELYVLTQHKLTTKQRMPIFEIMQDIIKERTNDFNMR